MLSIHVFELCNEAEMPFGVCGDEQEKLATLVQFNRKTFTKTAGIDRSNIADEGAAAPGSILVVDEAIADGEVRAVAQDQPAVAGFMMFLDFDCRPIAPGGGVARKGSADPIRRPYRPNCKD